MMKDESECPCSTLRINKLTISRPNSKAYVNGLRDKIQHLEALLEEKERRLAAREQDASSTQHDVNQHDNIFEASTTDTFDFGIPQLPPSPGLPSFSQEDFAIDASSPANSTHSNSSSTRSIMVNRLLSTKGHLSFDQLSGRLRYYGPTTNCHVYSELVAENEEHNRQALEQRRRTQRVLSTLPQETQDYLMQMFWQYYNSVIHVIHQAAFEEGMQNGQGQFYSPFLHICILSMGYRHADKTRSDMMKIALPGKESTLHREAKYMLDYELERPGGVTSVQALLLLGDLECGVGRDNLGWLISGMANRLCFDIGLHLDNSASGLSQLEVEIDRMTLWACVIYDRYWALFLGRPTALKPGDLEVYRLAAQFERLGTLEPAGPSRSREKETYEALLDLMELAGKITDIMDKASKPNAQLDQHVYITMAALNRELETWYSRLPPSLQWTAENIEGAPFSYFLLHQQYHAAMILLHRQFAQYDEVGPSSGEQGIDAIDFSQASYFATLSRMTCTRSAGRIAQIFWQHRQTYDTKKIFVTGLQHAGTAAIALIASVASPKDRVSYDTNMKYLECLAAAINDMAETYQPAERMSSVLKAVLDELKAARPVRQYASTVPARRDSSSRRDSDFEWNPPKRHQTSRPGMQRTISQLSQPPAFLQTQSRRHTTTGMPPPSLPVLSSQKITTTIDPSTDGFTVASAGPDTEALGDDWNRFDDASSFMMDDSTILPHFARATSPSPYGQTWMGAETPKFSPMPTSVSALYVNTQQEVGSNPNLDFMTMLNNGIDHESNISSRLEIQEIQNNADAEKGTNTTENSGAALNSLLTPTSQTSTNHSPSANKNGRGPRNDSRSRSRQRTANTTNDKGIAHTTMAGLDDIWREMMRSNQSGSTEDSSSKR